MNTTFKELIDNDAILESLNELGYEKPSPIQEKTIPHMLAGRDVVGLAQTGTGKTAAFALPILARIDPNLKKTQALILAPTRELALQVSQSCEQYAKFMKINILPIYGGQSYNVQLSGLKRGAQIVVGTPGRVIDHLEKKTLDLSGIEYLVLDEADEMLTMGFQEDVERILRDTPEKRQVALFSATMPQAIARISKKYLNNPQEVTVESKTTTSSTITQRYVVIQGNQKTDALSRFLEIEDHPGIIVFVRTKQSTEELASALRARGFAASAINGDMVQAQRERTISDLKTGKVRILIATDVAARGLDVDRISLVVNYDVPHDTESYVHRIGRTGRAGRTGEALLFVTPRERNLLKSIERATKQELTEIDVPTADQVNKFRISKFSDKITENLDGKHNDLFKELIENYAKQNPVELIDIAAAIAGSSYDGEKFLLTENLKKQEKSHRGDQAEFGRDRPKSRDRDRERGGRDSSRGRDSRGGDSRSFGNGNFVTYKIDVGTIHKVNPGQIVGAIANEGGLDRSDFGKISIRQSFSLVELPKVIDKSVLSKLKHTKVNNNSINIRPDNPPRGGGGSRSDSGRDKRGGKPKHEVWK